MESDLRVPLFDDLDADTGYSDRLEADRLTAEFQSPLNGGNLRRPLKAARVEQGEMFKAPEGARQERMF